MNRDAIKYLSKWFYREDRKPLIIRGARQVGKTTLIRLFAKHENIELIEVNMEDPQSFTSLLQNNQHKKFLKYSL